MAEVKVKDGVLEGSILESDLGFQYYSFKGIPYAEPPVGKLRFKPPQPVQPWDGIKEAREHGPVCLQYYCFYSRQCLEGSEDCLYLNVYSKDIKPKKPLPVMVWIHGGSFLWGSGNSDFYGPDFLIDKDVILVTFNYRLGIFGFLNLDTKEVPGNAGMKDQVAALKWVKHNIECFGGDPNNITIFGESAGGASVSYHLVSPMSKGLFNRAIVQSGSLFCAWTFNLCSVDVAFATAKLLGKETSDIQELYNFFLSAPANTFINVQPKILCHQNTRPWISLNYNVVEEKDFGQERFFDGNKYEIHDNVDVIIGYTEDEGIFSTGLSFPLENLIEKCNAYLDSMVPENIVWKLSPLKQIQVGKKFKEYYFGKKQVAIDNLDQLLKYSSMDYFKFDILHLSKILLKKPRKVFFYNFNCISKRNFSYKGLTGTVLGQKPYCVHGDDLVYLFNCTTFENFNNEDGWSMVDNMVRLWTNFAKLGDPTPDQFMGVKWSPFCLEKQEYLEINENLIMKQRPADGDWQFWENIYKTYLPEEYP